MNMNCACSLHANEGKSYCRFAAKASSYTTPVAKVDHGQDGPTTRHVRKEISVFMATNGPFWQSIC